LPPIAIDPEVLALGAAARGPVYPLSPIPSGEAASPAKAPTPLVDQANQVRLHAALEKLERAEAILAAVAAFQRRAF
jgi:hypothetical protein